VQEGEQTIIGLAFDGEIVEAVTAGQGVGVEQRRRTRRAHLEQRRAAVSEQIGVAQLVDCMLEIEPAQQRIRSELRGAQNVASTVAFDLGERDQFADTAVEVAPHPSMKGPQYSIQTRDMSKSHGDCPSARKQRPCPAGMTDSTTFAGPDRRREPFPRKSLRAP
jgi:hypothetical protein